MGLADRHGKARVDPRNPRAFAECDSCGVWYNRDQLVRDMQYSGTRLFWTGYFVCPTCNDKPNAQFLNPILPGDPKPVIEPRPALPTSAFIAPGFTLFEMELQPNDPAAVLAQVAALSGVATPASAAFFPVTIATPQQAQQIIQPTAGRTWLVVYNPTTTPIVVSTGQAAFSGDPKAIVLGAGQAMFGNAPVYQGALTAIGYFGGVSLLVGEAPVAVGAGPPFQVIHG
jgi:hypothetical protein